MANIWDKLKQYAEASLDSRLNDLNKAERSDGNVGRKGLIFDPFTSEFQSSGLFKQRISYLSPAILKQVSRRNIIVASAIDTRASQISSACKRPSSRFDWGFKINPKDNSITADPKEVAKIEEFILNCGQKDDRPTEDKLTFDQWGYMFCRDIMVYGHAAIEKVLRKDGSLHSFLPLPAETIFYANKKVDQKVIESIKNAWEQTIDSNVDVDRAAKGEYEFVQVLNGKVVEGFTKEELIFARFNLETDIDLNGYCYGPLERAIGAVISHMQIENHQRQFFVHGVASKGLLVLQGDVTPNTLKTLQAQWNNQITGPLNAWRTPILAGIKGVQWVPLTASNRDMEYAAWQDYIIRVMCAALAITPEEIGFDYLSKGTEQKTMSESNNEWKLEHAKRRGIRPILGRIEAIINEEVLPALDEKLAEKYHFTFVGIDAESEAEETQRLQAETMLHTSLNEARKQTEREPLPFGGELILNPTLLQYLQLNMPKGLFMEKFMGITGASQRPDLQYVPDPLWFQWQQMQQQMLMAQQGGGQPGPDGGGDPSQGGAPQDGEPPQDGQPQSPEDQQAQEQEQAEMQDQQNQAIEQYMAANPELFKAFLNNRDRLDELSKSERVAKRVNVARIEKSRDALVKDFRKGSETLVKEIMQIVADDLKAQSEKKPKK